jgi:hypothetical protein
VNVIEPPAKLKMKPGGNLENHRKVVQAALQICNKTGKFCNEKYIFEIGWMGITISA